jgi:hypothetical protein
MENVELDETLFEKIKEGDTIYCDFDSNDIWLKLHLDIKTSVKNIIANLSVKVPMKAPITDFKFVIQKLVYIVWNKYCDEDANAGRDFYFLKRLDISLSNDIACLIRD